MVQVCTVNATIRAILQGKWLIEKQWAENMLPAVATVLKGGQWERRADGPTRTGNEAMERPFLVEPKSQQRHEMYVFNAQTWQYDLNAKISGIDGLVAVVPISGPILKYNGSCGEAGSITRVGWLNILDNMPNVTGIVLLWDTPGGMIDGTNSLSTAIRGLKKYSISYVDDGRCCSAGMWGATSAKEFYASKATDYLGSIGVLCTLADFSGYYAELGIKVESIYAPQSTEKNIEYREWQANGNDQLIKDDLAVIAEDFFAAIKTNRPGAAKHEAKWNTGATFYAKDAQRLGLIDGIMPLSKVIQRAHFKGKNLSKMVTNNAADAATTNANTTVSGREQLLAGATVVAVGDQAPESGFIMSEEHIDAMGAMIDAAVAETARVAGEKDAQIADLQAQLDAANAQLTAANAAGEGSATASEEEMTALQQRVATLEQDNASLQEQVATLQAENAELGGQSSTQTGTELTASTTPAADSDKPSWYVPDGSESKLKRQSRAE